MVNLVRTIRIIACTALACVALGGASFAAAAPAQASLAGYQGYTYGWDSSGGGHWFVEFNVSPLRAHNYAWHSVGPRGQCDDPNIKSACFFGEPCCSTW